MFLYRYHFKEFLEKERLLKQNYKFRLNTTQYKSAREELIAEFNDVYYYERVINSKKNTYTFNRYKKHDDNIINSIPKLDTSDEKIRDIIVENDTMRVRMMGKQGKIGLNVKSYSLNQAQLLIKDYFTTINDFSVKTFLRRLGCFFGDNFQLL